MSKALDALLKKKADKIAAEKAAAKNAVTEKVVIDIVADPIMQAINNQLPITMDVETANILQPVANSIAPEKVVTNVAERTVPIMSATANTIVSNTVQSVISSVTPILQSNNSGAKIDITQSLSSNKSNNNIIAIDDKYSLVGKHMLNAKYSIDIKDVWKKVNYIYGVLDNDIYSDRSSEKKLKVVEDNLTVKLVGSIQNGELDLNKDDGTFKYTPNKGFSGEDMFTYQVCKQLACSNVATVTITMKNYAPKAKDDSYIIREDTVLNVNTPKELFFNSGLKYGVLNNDKDQNNNELSAELISNVKHGILNFYKDGTFKYTPNKGYYGKEEFSYKAFDGIEYSSRAKVLIKVGKNIIPQAIDDKYKMKQGEILHVDREIASNSLMYKLFTYGVLSNDIDLDNDKLTARVVESPKHGMLDFNQDGTFQYIPNNYYTGDDYFTYIANDGTIDSNLATSYIIVHPLSNTEL